MRPSTLLSLCVFVMLALLATQARPAHGALILPLVIYKKLPKHKLLVPVPLPLPLPIPIPIVKPKMLSLLLPKLPRIGITLHLGKGHHSPLRHLRIHHKPKLVHLDHGHDDHEYHHSHSSHQPHHHHGPPSHSGEDEVYEVKNPPPSYPAKDWKS
ncbi:uncharacterized protein LOC119396600 [Rhipicephalus sanguineus]|uniref:uncharacterized protein LOC119396600 n=1 Tax=Rhipicephalus sanguineus TaxID=34632 RepID=UPI0018945987|nr:uncharacterized protein LOC119396600 [Rhipicephalus sanguineus]